jgi:hypothetical protein
MKIGRWFLDKYPDSPLARSDMAVNHYLLGSAALDRRDLPDARAHYEAAVEFSTWLTERAPKNRQYRALLVQEHIGLGRTSRSNASRRSRNSIISARSKSARAWFRRTPATCRNSGLCWRCTRSLRDSTRD